MSLWHTKKNQKKFRIMVWEKEKKLGEEVRFLWCLQIEKWWKNKKSENKNTKIGKDEAIDGETNFFFFGKGGKVHTHSLFPLKMMNMERQGICCIRDAFEIPECKNQRMHRRQWDEEKTKSEMEIKSKNKKGKAVNRYKTR